eukprot:Nitzschia sp. Nitz4//scaffold43_size134323//2930//3829//NITZ4_003275-RA/size134323-processed-gene-0.0-mRNA-1//1//CDS//3329551876//1574//frame0
MKSTDFPTTECKEHVEPATDIETSNIALESCGDFPNTVEGGTVVGTEKKAKGSDPEKDIESNLGATESSDETLHEDEEGQVHKVEEETSSLLVNLFLFESLFVLGVYLFAVHEVLGVSAQSYVLWAYGVLYIARLNAKVRWFSHRNLTSTDLTWVILCWIPGAMLSNACLAFPVANNGILICSLILYTLGWTIGVRSEWQRKAWEDEPQNWGKLYTSGLFARSRHINYFCQVLLFTAWALASASPFNAWIPLVTALGFNLFQIPKKEERLAEHFAEEWKEYVKKTPSAFVPLGGQASSR